jgi:hypothetical protein
VKFDQVIISQIIELKIVLQEIWYRLGLFVGKFWDRLNNIAEDFLFHLELNKTHL